MMEAVMRTECCPRSTRKLLLTHSNLLCKRESREDSSLSAALTEERNVSFLSLLVVLPTGSSWRDARSASKLAVCVARGTLI